MKQLRKVLVVVLDNLGDTVMATSVLRPIRRLLPGVRIGMFVKKYAAGVLLDHSMIDRLHAADPFWDVSPGQAAGGIARFLAAAYAVRREGYDTALILNTEWRRALTTLAAGIPLRVGYDRRRADDFLTVGIPPGDGHSHFVEDHRRLVEVILPAAAGEDFLPRLELAPAEAAWVDQWRRERGWNDAAGYAVIHPFSGDERKNWPLDRWRSLSDWMFRQTGTRFAVLCSGSEKVLLDGWIREAPAHVHFVTGAPLQQVKAVVARARMVVGGDSGIGHVAAALGTPVLSLFGPGDPARCAPIGSFVTVLRRHPLASLDIVDVESAAVRVLNGEPVEDL